MPFGEYKDFNDCVEKNKDKDDPKAYCAVIKRNIEESVDWNTLSDDERKEELSKLGFDMFQDYNIEQDYKDLHPMIQWKIENDDKIADHNAVEAEYKGKKVTLNKPFRTPNESKKFAVYVQNDKGNVQIVRFGDPNMEIKRDDPDRRKAFRTRHNCDQAKDKTTAGYWSCKMWSSKNVSDITSESKATEEDPCWEDYKQIGFKNKNGKKVPNCVKETKELESFDPKELEMGKKIELEHTDDSETAERIAKDHLREVPDYYTKLKKYVEPQVKESCGCSFNRFIEKQMEALQVKAREGQSFGLLYDRPEISGKKIKGTLAYAGVSLNDRLYLPEELAKGHGMTLPLILNHASTAGAENELHRLPEKFKQGLENGLEMKVGSVKLDWDKDKLTLFYEGTVDDEFFKKEIDDAQMAVSLGMYYDSDSPKVCDEKCYTVINGAEFHEVSLVYHAGFPIATIEAVESYAKETKYQCPKCDKIFNDANDFVEHQIDVEKINFDNAWTNVGIQDKTFGNESQYASDLLEAEYKDLKGLSFN
jgi:predicted Fe-S protein YdhL (DUF1289 family)